MEIKRIDKIQNKEITNKNYDVNGSNEETGKRKQREATKIRKRIV